MSTKLQGRLTEFEVTNGTGNCNETEAIFNVESVENKKDLVKEMLLEWICVAWKLQVVQVSRILIPQTFSYFISCYMSNQHGSYNLVKKVLLIHATNFVYDLSLFGRYSRLIIVLKC